MTSRKDGRLDKLVADYKELTGKDSLLYKYSPTPRQTKYVFVDKVCLSYESAIKHILALISKARDEAA
jgi:hypothetical protein